MNIELSTFGNRLGAHTGIQELMHDLGQAMAGQEKLLMLGGGNPAAIPAAQALYREKLRELLDSGAIDPVLGNYDTPQGSPAFLEAVAGLLRREFGWNLTRDNIAVTNGSQNAFFYLFNLLAGEFPDGRHKKILLPLCPEYIGYADQGVDAGLFTSCRPLIEDLGDRVYKYRVDFDALEITPDIAAIAVSRPTNPTGNVLTDAEVARLSAMAKAAGIPLILDNAYGAPFPGILFGEAAPHWDEHVILGLSLSKLGLPGLRTGILVASADVIRTLAGIHAVIGLASGNVGQAIVGPMMRDGSILTLSREVIRPFYQEKSLQAQAWLREFLGERIPWRMHASEGAMFQWLNFPGLPGGSKELYNRLRKRGVVVVSGHYFFFGLPQPWDHANECLRLNTSQPADVVREGLRLVAEEAVAMFGRS
jgi:valine--pyruvate aminotransferase